MFRGALLNPLWINDWVDKIGLTGADYVSLNGNTSTYKNFEVALNFSKCDTDYGNNYEAALFVFSIRNYAGFEGFRMTNVRYSAFPQE